ncbi:MAG: ArnT family glycosyltransferase, partial [Candidatus Kapaibacteriota bacterium]
MVWTKRDSIISLILACIAGFLFIPFAGNVPLFDGEELKLAEISREMLLTGDYARTHLNFQASWDKPPLFFWIQAASMHLLGFSEFAVRLPNALLGIITLPMLYAIGKTLSGRSNYGVLWALCFGASAMPIMYFRFATLDALSHCFLLLGIAALSSYYAPSRGKRYTLRRILIAGFVVGLALLTKGIGVVVVIAVLWLGFWLFCRRISSWQEPFPLTELAVLCALALVMSFAWYGGELLRGGVVFFRGFVQNRFSLLLAQASLPHQSSFSVIIWILLGCFPASGLVVPTLRQIHPSALAHQERTPLAVFRLWMVLLLLLVVVMCILGQTYVADYSSLAYFPITFLAADMLDKLLRREIGLSRPTQALMLGMGLGVLVLMAIILLGGGVNMAWIREQVPTVFFPSPLLTSVEWSAWERGITIVYIITLLAAAYFLVKKRVFEMMLLFFPATALAMGCLLALTAPKIEHASQGAVREFYQGLQGQKCYVRAL